MTTAEQLHEMGTGSPYKLSVDAKWLYVGMRVSPILDALNEAGKHGDPRRRYSALTSRRRCASNFGGQPWFSKGCATPKY